MTCITSRGLIYLSDIDRKHSLFKIVAVDAFTMQRARTSVAIILNIPTSTHKGAQACVLLPVSVQITSSLQLECGPVEHTGCKSHYWNGMLATYAQLLSTHQVMKELTLVVSGRKKLLIQVTQNPKWYLRVTTVPTNMQSFGIFTGSWVVDVWPRFSTGLSREKDIFRDVVFRSPFY